MIMTEAMTELKRVLELAGGAGIKLPDVREHIYKRLAELRIQYLLKLKEFELSDEELFLVEEYIEANFDPAMSISGWGEFAKLKHLQLRKEWQNERKESSSLIKLG